MGLYVNLEFQNNFEFERDKDSGELTWGENRWTGVYINVYTDGSPHAIVFYYDPLEQKMYIHAKKDYFMFDDYYIPWVPGNLVGEFVRNGDNNNSLIIESIEKFASNFTEDWEFYLQTIFGEDYNHESELELISILERVVSSTHRKLVVSEFYLSI